MSSVVHAPHQEQGQSVRETHGTEPPRRLSDRLRPATTQMVTGSAAMDDLLRQADKVAGFDLTVLIAGESGTGKSTLARHIHERSPRRNKPLMIVNCAAIPRDLLESELFGHVKGAFTGAVADRAGRVESCDGGTLVLDEVGDLPLDLQPKLLMFLQDRVYFPIGSDTARHADVRLIAATNRPLLELCQTQKFREDLYYRLSVLRLDAPALRDQPDMIPYLASSILQRIADRTGAPPKHLTAHAVARLQQGSWNGNVRELENVLERAAVYCEDEHIDTSSLQFDATPTAAAQSAPSLAGRTLHDIESQAISETLESCGGNRAMAARQLGISERSIYNKIKRLKMA